MADPFLRINPTPGDANALGGAIGAATGSPGLRDVMAKLLNERYQSSLAEGDKFRQNFKENPVGTFAKDAMFGLNMIGPRVGPVSRPNIVTAGGGAKPPPGEFLQPRLPSMPGEGAFSSWGNKYTPQGHMAQAVRSRPDPVEGMKAYAQEMPFLDPKRVSSTYQNIYPEPGEAASVLERQTPVTIMSPAPEAAAILRRRQALIESMTNPDNMGPWGMRSAAGQ
jgi:hypothetical protein